VRRAAKPGSPKHPARFESIRESRRIRSGVTQR
jgi:hypothetical protein